MIQAPNKILKVEDEHYEIVPFNNVYTTIDSDGNRYENSIVLYALRPIKLKEEKK